MKKGRKRYRRRSNLPMLLVLTVLWLAAWTTLVNSVFVVRNVEVEGAGNMSPEAVIRLSGIRLGTKLNALNDVAIKANVDAIGTLAFVELQKRYPVTARLVVRPRTHDAVTLQAGKLLTLDSDGYVVSASETLPEQALPLVTGLRASTFRLGRQLDAAPSRLTAMKAVLEALRAKHAAIYVSEVDVDYPTDIKLITRTGMTVLLGGAENMEKKIVWMAATLQDLERRGETLGRLDVSSGTKADYLPMVVATPTPVPTQETYLLMTATPAPTGEPIVDDGMIIGEDAI